MTFQEARNIIKPLIDRSMMNIVDLDDYARAEQAFEVFFNGIDEKDLRLIRLETMLNDSQKVDEEWAAKLRPCPVCGKHVNMIKTFCVNTRFTSYHIEHESNRCPLSNLHTPNMDSAEELVRYWNHRKEG